MYVYHLQQVLQTIVCSTIYTVYYVLFPLTTVTDDIATYKVQEYFSYNENSFYDLECDLEKHRLEQPSPTKH